MIFKEQDPNEILDYTVDYSDVLADGESIVSSVWFVSGSIELGIGIYVPTFSASAATCWLLSGSIPSDSKVTNRVTTNNVPARTFERSFIVRTVDK